MTVENVRESIGNALSSKSHEPVPRISKREAQHIIKAAEQGAGPDPLGEIIFVTSLVFGPKDPLLLEMLQDISLDIPDQGTPGIDFIIDEEAMKNFNAFFRKYHVPLGETRQIIIEELQKQVLNRGKNRAKPEGIYFKVHFKDFLNDPWIGHIDSKNKLFFS
ncbi:MAG TPA: hypothetical protein ENN23_09130 [Deltaproteobacteria bacterium]|nr:hypothetical protein [Deltaproteobacteria bacterium]